MKKRTGVLYAGTLDELRAKTIGYHHDHCYHLYFGLTENVPEKIIVEINKDNKYVFIYEEDIPQL